MTAIEIKKRRRRPKRAPVPAAIARVDDGAPVVFVTGVDALWHLPHEKRAAGDERKTLCGLSGLVFAYGAIAKERRCCSVCATRAPRGVLKRIRKPHHARSGRKRGGNCRITETQIRALHLLHWEEYVSINEIARRYHQKLGYASQGSFCSNLCTYFKDRGLPTHDRIEMTVRASTKHGQCRRNAKSSEKKRFLAQRRGDQYDKPCTGTTTRGKPCRVRAMIGSDFCQFHDPSQRERWVAATAAMRAIYQLHDPAKLEPAGPITKLLHAYHADGGGWRALSRQTGIPDHWLAHVARGKQERVDKQRAQRVREALLPVEINAPSRDVDDERIAA